MNVEDGCLSAKSDSHLTSLTSPLLKDVKPNNEGTFPQASEPNIKVYKRRWWILILFALYAMHNAYQWLHLNIITNILLVYYNQSLPALPEHKLVAINWLSLVFLLVYVIIIIPVTWLLNRKGLRWIALLGALFNCLGGWIKCASVNPNRFWVLMVSQLVCAVADVFIYGMQTRVAAVWFGPKQVSTANALGTLGIQMGMGLGFLITPLVVQLHPVIRNNTQGSKFEVHMTLSDLNLDDSTANSSMMSNHTALSPAYDLQETGHSMERLFYGSAVYGTILFIIVVLGFQKEPLQPPSIAQHKIRQEMAEPNYLVSLLRLFQNGPYMLLVLTYGVLHGIFISISTLLNSTILGYFNVKEYQHINQDAGRIGLMFIVAGMIGSVLVGVWLDVTKSFRATSVIVYFMSFVGVLTFTLTLYLYQVWVIYLTASFLGFWLVGYMTIGFEYAAELSYPECEGTSSGLINASAMIFGMTMTTVMGWMYGLEGNPQDNIRNANLLGCGMLLLGFILTALLKSNLRRFSAERTD